jgi:hypothetical protein
MSSPGSSPTTRINDYIKEFNDDLNELSGDFDLFISPLKSTKSIKHTYAAPVPSAKENERTPGSSRRSNVRKTLQPMQITNSNVQSRRATQSANGDCTHAVSAAVSALCIQMFRQQNTRDRIHGEDCSAPLTL